LEALTRPSARATGEQLISLTSELKFCTFILTYAYISHYEWVQHIIED
jgi:hypothetical protein